MRTLVITEHPEFGKVRTVEAGGRVWFCARDVASALGYANPKDCLLYTSTISLVIEALNVPISPNLIFLPLSSSSSNWVRRASITPLTSAEVIVQLLEIR